MVAVGVRQVLVNANSELNKLVSDAVKLGLGTGDGLNGLEDLRGGVSSSRGNATLVEEGEEVDLALKLDRVVEVIVLVVDVGAGGAGAVLVELMSPEAFFVVALQIRPHGLQTRDQISDILCVELRTAVAGPSAIVVLGPESVDDPVVKTVRSRVASGSSTHRTRPTSQ